MPKATLMIMLLLSLALPSPAWLASSNASSEAPIDIPNAIRVDAEGLIKTLAEHPELVLIDARIAMDRKQGYIENSISLPDIETDCGTLQAIIPAYTHPVLFYCNGPKCGRSVKSIHKAHACGYTHLYWYRGGFEEWVQKGYPFLKD